MTEYDRLKAQKEAILERCARTDVELEMYQALKAWEALEQKVANCDEHEGGDPELCEKCFPYADDARIKMRNALRRTREKWAYCQGCRPHSKTAMEAIGEYNSHKRRGIPTGIDTCWFVESKPNGIFEGWWAGPPKGEGGWLTADPLKAKRYSESEAKAVAQAMSYFPTPFGWSNWIATEHVFLDEEKDQASRAR